MEAWLEQREEDALRQEHSGDFQEQCLHWWSNEYPGFIAEACCRSLPVATSDKPGQVFDGTLRVAFALRRPEQEDLPAERGLEVDWLGGYWKLPRAAAAAAIPHGGGGDAGAGSATPREVSLEEVRARVVSSFSSAEKRTAEVEKAHLEEVYSVLAPALLRVIRIGGAIDAMSLMHGYRATPAVCAFLLARAAAAMRRDKMRNAKNLLDLAKGLVPAPKAPTAGNMPERSALSYIERNLAVCCLMEQHQQLTGRGRLTLLDAVAKVDSSLRWLPTSASAHYIKGRCHHDAGEFEPGARCLLKAVALDPDFKQPYLALGNCLLQLGRFRAAAEASRACLSRHSDSPTAHFNLGQAYYQMLWEGLQPKESAAEVRRLGAEALRYVRENDFKLWRPADECMLQYLLAEQDGRGDHCREPVHTRKVFGWRP
uniref:Uncharacterized protein n=1 Tax=Pyrodinium bahamense TaxID=73915 RepID=A0A7S0FR54_9DINO